MLGVSTLMLTSMLTIMVGSAIAPSLVEINTHLDFKFDPGLLITLPSLGVVLFSVPVGKWLQQVGSFRLLCIGLIPYAVMGACGAFITNSYLLMVDRVLLGGAAVAVQIAATTIIAEQFTGAQRLKVMAWQGMAIEGGGVLFLSVGGILGGLHWQLPFAIYLVAVLCLALAYWQLPKSAPLQETAAEEDDHAAEASAKKRVYVVFLAALLAMTLFFVSFTRLPQYLPQAFGFSESQTGYLMSFISLIAVLTASQMPRLVRTIGGGYTTALGFLFFMGAYLIFATAATSTVLYLGAFVMGVGFGLNVPTLNHMMVDISTPHTRGKNLGLYSLGIFGGQFISTFLGLLFNQTTLLFAVTAALCLVAAVSLAFAFRRLFH